MPIGTSAYIIDTKPEPIYASGVFITGSAYSEQPEPYGSGDYADPVYPAQVTPYTP